MRARTVRWMLAAALVGALAWWPLALKARPPSTEPAVGTSAPEGPPAGLSARPPAPETTAMDEAAPFAPAPDPRRVTTQIEGVVRRDGTPTSARVDLRLMQKAGPDGYVNALDVLGEPGLALDF